MSARGTFLDPVGEAAGVVAVLVAPAAVVVDTHAPIMRVHALIVVSALAIAAAVTAAAAAAPTRASCTPGQSTIDGNSAMTFCGPAKATVRVNGKTYALKGGSCLKTGKYVNVNIGTVVLGAKSQKLPYFRHRRRRVSGRQRGGPRLRRRTAPTAADSSSSASRASPGI